MVANHQATSKPITLVSTEKLGEAVPGIFLSCVVSPAMAKSLRRTKRL